MINKKGAGSRLPFYSAQARRERSAKGTARMRPPFSFPRKKTGVARPKERRLHCKRAARRAAMLADCTDHSAALPRLKLLYDLPLLLLSAVAQPLAALLPYGCGTPLAGAALPISWQCSLISVYRQSHQCGERSNAAISHAVCRPATVTRASR